MLLLLSLRSSPLTCFPDLLRITLCMYSNLVFLFPYPKAFPTLYSLDLDPTREEQWKQTHLRLFSTMSIKPWW